MSPVERQGVKDRTFIMSRTKACVPLGSTGYPFAFEWKVEAGRKMKRVGSAIHWSRTFNCEGSGGVKSNAEKQSGRVITTDTLLDKL